MDSGLHCTGRGLSIYWPRTLPYWSQDYPIWDPPTNHPGYTPPAPMLLAGYAADPSLAGDMAMRLEQSHSRDNLEAWSQGQCISKAI